MNFGTTIYRVAELSLDDTASDAQRVPVPPAEARSLQM